MTLYICLTIWMLLLTILGLRPDSELVVNSFPDKPKSKIAKSNLKIVNFLSAITLTFLWGLTAFRSSGIGNDTQTYIYYFNIFKNSGIDKTRTFELGYQYLNFLIGKITDDPHVFLIIIATILYGSITYYLYRYSKNILISLCLFFCICFSMFTSMFRQGIAMVIAMFGYQLLKKNKKIKAAIVFIFAMLFHTSAIVCFLLFFNLKILKKRWVVFCITGIVILISITGIFNSVVITILPRYAHYFDSRYASTGWLAVSYSLVRNSIWYLLVSNGTNENESSEQIAVTNMTFLLIFSAFGYSVNLFTRAGEFFVLNAIIDLPNMMYSKNIKNRNWWMLGICMVMLIMFLIELIFRPGWNHIYPYEFWN